MKAGVAMRTAETPAPSPAVRPRLVVIGNGMAGGRMLEELLAIAAERYDITVFGAEPHPNYNRILLTPVLAGEQRFEDILLNDAAWHARNGIRLHLSRSVVRIDRGRRVVIDDLGQATPYDRLVLATGSRPAVLPVPGCDLPGVVTYRDIADTETMIAAAERHRHAVVIGGGLLGVEAANGLSRRGMAVTLVHVMPWLMERQLDEVAGQLLARSLEARGIAVRLNARTEAIVGGGHAEGVRLKDDAILPAGLVVMAVGIRPNVELAEQARLHCQRGIVVSDTLQTSDPRIYAVGECVAHRGVNYGLVAPLYDMSRVCANHLAYAGFRSYHGSVPATRLKVTGIDVFSAGSFMGGPGTEALVLRDGPHGIYRKLVLRDDRLVGAVLFGDVAHATRYLELIELRAQLAPLRDRLMFDPEETAA